MAKGIAVGLSRGHIVTKIEVPSWVAQKRRNKETLLIFSFFFSKSEKESALLEA